MSARKASGEATIAAVRRLLRRAAGAGLKRAYQATRRLLSDLLIERRRGLDTSTLVSLEELGVAAEDRVHYEPSGWLMLRRVFRREVRDDDVLLDIGSGKGRVLLEAARHPFKRVVGVEISATLNAVARRNLERSLPRLRCKEFELVTSDIATYEVPDDVTMAYLYNPVRGETFAAAVAQLIASYDRRPRRLRIVYRSPFDEPQLLATGRVRLVAVLSGIRPWSTESSTRIYEVIP